MIRQKKEPIRLCVACRLKNNKKELIRVVRKKDGEILVDELKKEQGRGAYLCSSEECFKLLQKKKGLERSFKCKIAKEIYLKLEEKLKKKD